MSPRELNRQQLARHIRGHVQAQFYDESSAAAVGTALYSLSDPRELRQLRYIGQTTDPRRRFLQHLNAARLWLPRERPWWIKSPQLRPLYGWIRDLYADEYRLPTMIVGAWLPTQEAARQAERARIHQCLSQQLPLLNVESEILGRQLPLL